tara:strand:+ start:5278 stop:7014 length:1737 start_codon:yes stop_codon:yes gene_type:complete
MKNLMSFLFIVLVFLTTTAFKDSPHTKDKLLEKHAEAVRKVVAEMPPVVPQSLDFRKKHHYDFYRTTLLLSGKTPKSHPNIFKTLEKARDLHKKSGPPDHKRALYEQQGNKIVNITEGGYQIGPIQLITSFGNRPSTRTYDTTAISSIPKNPVVSQLHLGVYDQDGHIQGQLVSNTQNYSGTDQTLSTNGTLDASDLEARSISTFFWEDQNGAPHHGMVYASSSISPPTVIDPGNPKDVNGDGIIKLCLARQATDCDYQPAGGSGSNVIMPINGSITYADPIDIPITSSNSYSLITIANPDPKDGGGCHIIKSTTDFFSNATVNGAVLTWNLQPAHFEPANGCLVRNSNANYTFNVMIQNNNLPVYVSITDTPGVSPDPYTKIIAPMQVWYSCVAEGTQITLADGTTKKIENVVADDKIFIDSEGRVMTVKTTVKGKEENIFRLTTASGKILRVTGGHAIPTDSGVILAKNLITGNQVESIKGFEELTSIQKEPYGGNVYNLILGTETDLIKATQSNTTFYANGIRIGDAQMQFTYGNSQINYTALTEDEVLEKLPEAWHPDFHSDKQHESTNLIKNP